MSGLHAISVLIEDRLITLTRALGLLRRRNLPVRSIAVGPTERTGLSRLTIMMQSDDMTAERAVQHLQKLIGVREATAFPAGDGVARELALIKVRAPASHYGELLDVLQLYRATIVDDSPDAMVVEVTGSEAFVLSCIRALEPFGIVEIARSGAIALEVAGNMAEGADISEGAGRMSQVAGDMPQDMSHVARDMSRV